MTGPLDAVPLHAVPGLPARDLRLLQAGSLTSTVDRFVPGPVLVGVAAEFHASLGRVAPVAGAYYLTYGLSQPVWGWVSERLGRVRTMRAALLLAGLAGLTSAAMPHLGWLVLLRAVTGACMSAVVPGGLVYVGDAVPFRLRQRTVTDLNAATAIGITAATGLGGVVSSLLSWRVAFALPAAGALALCVAMRHLPEPSRGLARGRPAWRRVVSAWPAAVLALALVEGAALLGPLTYFAPVLHDDGLSTTVAGLLAATYGLGLFAGSRVVKRLLSRLSAAACLATGSALLVTALGAVALDHAPSVVTLAAVMVGAGWSFMHSTMQAWSTEVLPEARALLVSLFAGFLFVGSGAATTLLGPLAGHHQWRGLFGSAAALALLFAAAAPFLRGRFTAVVT